MPPESLDQLLGEDTIAAVSTPPGEGGIAVIRVSGAQALNVVERVFLPSRAKGGLLSTPSHTLRHGWVVDPENGEKVDEVLIAVMRAPHTYTGEDVVEISCHGGRLVPRRILEVLLKTGARLAAPGEFTRRAFLHGRLDLSQAEAVADIIRASTDRALRAAIRHLEGELGNRIRQLRDQLLDVLAHLEAEVDFPEDDVPEVSRAEILEKIGAIRIAIEHLYQTASHGRLLREGVGTVIIGRPNVGKSSLLNRLLQTERAIVTEEPGTTRDVLEETLDLEGIPFRLIDTAGLRKAEGRAEQIGIERAHRALAEADLVLFVVDASQPLTEEDRAIMRLLAEKKGLVILNKCDQPLRVETVALQELGWPMVRASMLTGEGLAQIEAEMVRLAAGEMRDDLLVTNVRHQAALGRALEGLSQAEKTLNEGWPPDLASVDLRAALTALGEITGQSVDTEVVDRIFARFCVGK